MNEVEKVKCEINEFLYLREQFSCFNRQSSEPNIEIINIKLFPKIQER